MRNRETGDRLPPWSEEAERGFLGCLLTAPEVLDAAREIVVSADYFYDLRHGRLFTELVLMRERGEGIDLITVSQRLKDQGELENLGGIPGLSEIMNSTPAAGNWPEYGRILHEKYLARKGLAAAASIATAIWEKNGLDESGLASIARRMDEFKELSTRKPGVPPQNLKQPGDFGDAVFNQWFRVREDLPGWQLPFPFPYRVRDKEVTLLTGDSGSGKSTFMGQLLVCLTGQMGPGETIVVASFEMPAPITIWSMQRQALGRGPRMEDTEENRKTIAEVTAYLHQRLWIYDFLGIERWETVLDAFAYAREQLGAKVFVLDSIMRIGIPEDDLAQQSLAAGRFAAFATQGGHLFEVHHMNKSKEGNAKNRTTGSKRWTDNANNVLEFTRSEKKAAKMEEWKEELRREKELGHGEEAERDFAAKMKGIAFEPDGKLNLHKQRYPGAPQNGSKHLWFDYGSLQYRDRFQDQPVRYV